MRSLTCAFALLMLAVCTPRTTSAQTLDKLPPLPEEEALDKPPALPDEPPSERKPPPEPDSSEGPDIKGFLKRCSQRKLPPLQRCLVRKTNAAGPDAIRRIKVVCGAYPDLATAKKSPHSDTIDGATRHCIQQFAERAIAQRELKATRAKHRPRFTRRWNV